MHDPSKIGGGPYATNGFIQAISEITREEVLVLCADTLDDFFVSGYDLKKIKFIKVKARNTLEKVIGFFRCEFHRYKKKYIEVLSLYVDELDAVFFDGAMVAGDLSEGLVNRNIFTVAIHHNVESVYLKDSKSIMTIFGLSAAMVKGVEKKGYQKCDVNLFLTDKDKSFFERKYGGQPAKNFTVNSFSSNYDISGAKSIKKLTDKDKVILIATGSLSQQQTVLGVKQVIRYIYSLSKELNVDFEFMLCGSSPSSSLVRFVKSYDFVSIYSDLSNEDMNDVLNKSDVYICPVYLGSGQKLRVMDGLKAGIPIICHKTSVAGYEGAIGENWFKEYYDYESFVKSFADIYLFLEKGYLRTDITEFFLDNYTVRGAVEKMRSIFFE